MPKEETTTGVEETEAPAAGETEENSEDLFDYLGEEEGDKEDETAAGSETEDEEEDDEKEETEEASDDSFEDPKIEKAFASRLKAREAKLREELRTELLEEVRKSQPQYQYQPPSQPQPSMKEQIEKLADELALTPEATNVLYQQQLMLNQIAQSLQQTESMLSESQDTTTKSQAKLDIETRRKKNPLLPEFDDVKLGEIRKKYQKNHGVVLPWQDAYNFLVAEEAMSGSFNRRVQQDTLKNVGGRQKKTVQVKPTSPTKKPTLDDLTEEQFERMIQRAKDGEFKKS